MRSGKRLVIYPLLTCLVACGGGQIEPGGPAGAPTGNATTPDATEAPVGFLSYAYKSVALKTCDNKVRLGHEKRITLEAPETVGTTIFEPGCITDVRGDQVEITLDNTSTNLHNIIVEGNDHELVVGAGEKGSDTFQLPDDDEIGFQCTIHDRMYGAFFR